MEDPRNEARGCWIFVWIIVLGALFYLGKEVVWPTIQSANRSGDAKAAELKEVQRLADEGAKHPTLPKPTVSPTPAR